MTIREITPKDNPFIERIIKKTIVEFGLPTVGTAYEDIETIKIFESYQGENEWFHFFRATFRKYRTLLL